MKFLTITHERHTCLAMQVDWGEGPEIETVAQFFEGTEEDFIASIVSALNAHHEECAPGTEEGSDEQ